MCLQRSVCSMQYVVYCVCCFCSRTPFRLPFIITLPRVRAPFSTSLRCSTTTLAHQRAVITLDHSDDYCTQWAPLYPTPTQSLCNPTLTPTHTRGTLTQPQPTLEIPQPNLYPHLGTPNPFTSLRVLVRTQVRTHHAMQPKRIV
jgi:hypothetical protein